MAKKSTAKKVSTNDVMKARIDQLEERIKRLEKIIKDITDGHDVIPLPPLDSLSY